MKKFKGGLYADLSNYNTTLPNTEILLNFFKSNPIGYRSGGMVRGIAGGNPTGMRVTGGFLANAQKFKEGDTVSAYYNKIPSEQYTGGFSESGKPRHTLENWRAGGKTGDNPWLHSDDSWKDWAGEFFVGHKDYVYTGLPEDATYKDYMFELQRVRQPNQYNSKSSFEKGRKENEAKILADIEKKFPDRKKGDAHTGPNMSDIAGDKFGLENKEALQRAQNVLDKKEKERIEKEIKDEEEKLKAEKEGKIQKSKEEVKIDTSKISEGITALNAQNIAIKPKTYDESEDVEDMETTVQNLKDESTKLLEGRTKVSKDDYKFINEIGKKFEGATKEKDAPAWAMPLMIAGLNMAASDNPDMLGAMAEGGIKGVEEYARAKKEEKDDLKYLTELEFKKADLGLQAKGQIIADEQFNINVMDKSIQRGIDYINNAKNRIEARKLDDAQTERFWIAETNRLSIHNSNLIKDYAALDLDAQKANAGLMLKAEIQAAQISLYEAQALKAGQPAGGTKVSTMVPNESGVLESKDLWVTTGSDGQPIINVLGVPDKSTQILKTVIGAVPLDMDLNEWINSDEFQELYTSLMQGTDTPELPQ